MKKSFSLLISVVMFVGFLSSCILIPPVKYFPYDLMVNDLDLPAGFKPSGEEYTTPDNSISFEVSYANPNNKFGALFKHSITIYTDEKTAKAAYATWADKWFNEYYVTPTKMRFKPKSPEDVYQIGCYSESINGVPSQSCRFLQLHNNLIILAITNINSDNISFSIFDEILQKLDARLPSGDAPLPATKTP